MSSPFSLLLPSQRKKEEIPFEKEKQRKKEEQHPEP
jgi:hypothetical protein